LSETVRKFVRFCESEFGKTVLQREVEYVSAELKGAERVLNVGCGIGSLEKGLAGFHIVGLDSSEEMLQEARKRGASLFVRGDAEHLCFRGRSFDAALFITSLEFLAETDEAVEEAWRVTRPGGKILTMILNPASIYYKDHVQRENSYFRKAHPIDLGKIRTGISHRFHILKEEYFLGIRGEKVFDSTDPSEAALYVIVGLKRKTPD
jgi:ubiquinone/menaquinone biosynthesis C-methylase UbiE